MAFANMPIAAGLISYGVNLADNFRRAATYVVKILKGAKPGDLAVEFPNKLELIINLKTLKAPGGRPFADTCQWPLCARSGRWRKGPPGVDCTRRCWSVALSGFTRLTHAGTVSISDTRIG
jgi:ABC transporter substrate binding protein